MTKRPALGKGLGALIPVAPADQPEAGVSYCNVDEIEPNPDQPRTAFDPQGLESLAETIRNRGILQPLLVRRKGAHFELIAGERRLRAAKIAGLERVPIVIVDVDANDRLEISLLENIQREDLNPIEEAQAYRTLLDRLGVTQEELARKLGMERSSLANMVRLLSLPQGIQQDIASGRLTAGHGRALLALAQEELQLKVCEDVKQRRLSVRETEQYVKKLSKDTHAARQRKETGPARDPDIEHLEDELCKYYATRVTIVRRGKGGSIHIDYYSPEDLDRVYSLLTR
jgi:ParB family chromosome partitioning protein